MEYRTSHRGSACTSPVSPHSASFLSGSCRSTSKFLDFFIVLLELRTFVPDHVVAIPTFSFKSDGAVFRTNILSPDLSCSRQVDCRLAVEKFESSLNIGDRVHELPFPSRQTVLHTVIMSCQFTRNDEPNVSGRIGMEVVDPVSVLFSFVSDSCSVDWWEKNRKRHMRLTRAPGFCCFRFLSLSLSLSLSLLSLSLSLSLSLDRSKHAIPFSLLLLPPFLRVRHCRDRWATRGLLLSSSGATSEADLQAMFVGCHEYVSVALTNKNRSEARKGNWNFLKKNKNRKTGKGNCPPARESGVSRSLKTRPQISMVILGSVWFWRHQFLWRHFSRSLCTRFL